MSEQNRSGSATDANGNGYDSAAAQYNAIHEAHLAHEAILSELRQEIQHQQDKLAELGQSSGSDVAPRMEAVQLRLSELERKMSEGASDPLLNEIVHRLASLEQDPSHGGKDPQVAQLKAELEALKGKLDAPRDDPRTDAMVLRLASLEGAAKQTDSEERLEELDGRIDGLAQDLRERQASESETLRGQLDALNQKLEEAAQGATREAVEAVEQRLAGLEEASGKEPLDPRVDAVLDRLGKVEELSAGTPTDDEARTRIAALEESLEKTPRGPAPEELELRFEQLEQKLAGTSDLGDQIRALEGKLNEPDSATEEIVARLAALEEKAAEETGREDSDLAERLELLEQRAARLPEAERIDGFDRRIDQLEKDQVKAEANDPTQRLRELETRLDTISRSTEELTAIQERVSELAEKMEATPAPAEGEASPRLDELSAQLAELQTRVQDSEASTRLEDASSRLHSIEDKLRTLDEVADFGRRLTVLEMSPQGDPSKLEEFAQRLQAVEASPLPSDGEASADVAAELAEVKGRLAELEERPAEGGSDPQVSELLERIDSIERALPADGEFAGDPRVSEVLGRMDSLERSLPAAGEAPSDPRVSELVARVDALAMAPASEDGGASSVLLQEIKDRLEALESASSDGPMGSLNAELSARFAEIEERISQSGGESPASSGDSSEFTTRLEQESEKWSQLTRKTLSDVGELRQQVAALENREVPEATGEAGEAAGTSNLEAIGKAISASMNGAEVKALRSQMYFIYFTIGMLWALGLYFLFTS